MTSVTLTDAQQTAIYEHERNLIVVAGAGSGKTYVLVERFLGLLDKNPDWPLNSLVAITFTKKAAQEMRDRVRRALEDRFQQTAHSLVDQAIWATRIANMPSARIDTIHGLCASILRANAAEAGVDPGFQVMEEIDAALLLDDCIDAVLQHAAHENTEPAELLTQYDTYIVRQVLGSFVNMDVPDLADDIVAHWNTIWLGNAQTLITNLLASSEYQQLTSWVPSTGWPTGSDLIYDIWLLCQPLITSLADNQDIEYCHDVLGKIQSSIKLTGGKQSAWGGAEILAESKDVLKTLRGLIDKTLKSIGDKIGEIDQRTARFVPLWMQLIQQTQTTYRTRKEAESLLDFDDLERLTRDLLSNNPAVRDRYRGTEFKHLLVDEFQDTNSVQWEIVQGLADIQRGGSLFVVGDPKQSIYQFRGADVSVFEAVKQQIIQSGGRDVALAQSFRTHEILVNGFNDLFSNLLARDLTSPAHKYEVEMGEPMRATRTDAPSDNPAIDFIYLDKNIGGDALDSEAMRRWEAHELATRLKNIVEVEKRLIHDKQLRALRPIGYGDIAILFQSTSNIVLYEDVFKLLQLPYVTIAGRGYYGRQEVWDLLNLLSALHNPEDNLALASALRSPLFGLSDDTLLTLRLQRDPNDDKKRLSLWKALLNTENIAVEEQRSVIFANDCLRRLRELAGRVSIADLLQSALDETGYLAILTSLSDGSRRRNNVEKLLEKAQASQQVTLGAFSQYLRDLSVREVREGEALLDVSDSVTLMTVHASKGLEYPLVALVDIGWSKGGGGGDAVMIDPLYGLVCKIYDGAEDKLVGGYAYQQAERLQALRETAERKRLFYVAATRAQDYLILSGQVLRSSKDTWFAWLSTAFELQDELEAGTRLLDKDWGQLKVTVPAERPLDHIYVSDNTNDTSGWEQEAVRENRPLPGESSAPFVGRIRVKRSDMIRHITATQIADAGSASDPFFRRKFRRSVLQDAPVTIDQVHQRNSHDVSQRIIGEMVHRVLGWWQFDQAQPNFDARLDSYAWELGVVDSEQRQKAVAKAHRLIDMMLQNEVYDWLRNAVHTYREIPFVYQSDKRIIHGILDVLFQRPDGTWVVLDYKTSHVAGYQSPADKKLVSDHALRYHLQIGVYAAAVSAQLGGIIPETYIYYIRYGQCVAVQEAEWTTAVSGLETIIGDLLDGQAD
ncbi:MAG: UvrD-helicase domain-containing protein [Chloroflexi bacterium]|nr:UvrD-helicase domain-containing protein [Chloroflexota bacterium]MCC6897085.1 UvrD-helicase domain-containing protein [Anaerolineae bacterium]